MKSLVILAGGKSSRMGQDKVLMEFGGKTFIERIFFNALECFQRVIISTDSDEHADRIRSLDAFKGRETEIVSDCYDSMGPMGGICSVFEACDVRKFAIISTDVPFADMRVLDTLYDSCKGKAAWLKIGDGRPEPLIAAYDRSAYGSIKASLDAGHLKMRQVFLPEEVEIIPDTVITEKYPGLDREYIEAAFRNINTPGDYNRLQDKRDSEKA